MTTLTKAHIVETLYEHMGLNKREGKQLVDRFFETISESLERGEEAKISGFGNFILCDKHARPGRNPKTGEDVEISARRVVTFHAGQKLRHTVEHSHYINKNKE